MARATTTFKKPRLVSNSDENELPTDPRTEAQQDVPISERFNPAFEEYYSEQIFKIGSESVYGSLSEFLTALKIALPMTLRVQQTRSKAVRMRTGEQLISLNLKKLDWVDQFLHTDEDEPSLVWECSHDEYHARWVTLSSIASACIDAFISSIIQLSMMLHIMFFIFHHQMQIYIPPPP
jgi:hypothetical protein